MAILAGLGFIVFPFAELISGQLYKFGGYFVVYGVSLAFSVIGVVYVIFIPESVIKRKHQGKEMVPENAPNTNGSFLDDDNAMKAHLRELGLGGKIKFVFNHGNQLVWRASK